MKSRDLRPFAVEHKHKRRPIAQPPASIWGDAVDHFRAHSEPIRAVAPDLIRVLHPVPTPEPQVGVEERRVLPDLRAAPVATAEEVGAIRVKRRAVNRTGGALVVGDSEKQHEHHIQVASTASDLPTELASEIAVESDARPEAEDTPVASFRIETRSDIVVTQEPWSAMERVPVIGRPIGSRRERTWTRKVDDLPRGERWRRRLPEVCR
jgi:hypothetical protein